METEQQTGLKSEITRRIRRTISRTKHWYRSLPDKKRYLEFVTAFLSIPVLLTVLINNVSTLKHQSAPVNEPTPTQTIIYFPTVNDTQTNTQTENPTPKPQSTPVGQCTPGIGPVDIAYPDDGETVTSDPVCLDITRQSNEYCAVVWSYRINNSAWSDYTDRSICMYGLTDGKKQLDLRIKSIVSGEERVIRRTFTVEGHSSPTPTSTASATPAL